jgi:hypothetical protein
MTTLIVIIGSAMGTGQVTLHDFSSADACHQALVTIQTQGTLNGGAGLTAFCTGK